MLRPLAIIRINENLKCPNDLVEFIRIAPGLVELTEKASDMLKNSYRTFNKNKMFIDFTRLSDLARYDMQKEFWSNVERIGNVNEMKI